MRLERMVKHVIFDMDGLMFDTEALCFSCEQKVAAKLGFCMDRSLYLQTLGVNHQAFCEILKRNLGEEFPAEQFSVLTYQEMDQTIQRQGVPVKPGLKALLAGLKELKITCSVASSSHSDRVRRLLSLAQIDDCFDSVIGGEMVTHSKPDPEIFLMACKNAQTAPVDALVLEDSPNGILAAHHAGIPVICVPDLMLPPEDILQHTSAVLPDLNQVLTLLTDINQIFKED